MGAVGRIQTVVMEVVMEVEMMLSDHQRDSCHMTSDCHQLCRRHWYPNHLPIVCPPCLEI